MALASRDRGGPHIIAQALIYPWLGLEHNTASYFEYSDGLGLTAASMRTFDRLYLPDNPDSDDPYARPIKARDFSGLPPALVHSAEMDPIRDDGRAYAAKLALAGNWVTYREARGMVHGFLRARFTGTAARAEFDVACAFLRSQLGL
jgi:acetyl esterase